VYDESYIYFLIFGKVTPMFAVIKTGGKQYTVHENDVLWVEKLDAETGASIVLDEVLMVSDGKNVTVGKPTIAGATVKATVVEQMRDRKVIIFKKKRRHNYRRKKGHRQHLTVLKIEKIVAAAAK
jgi:large subunit ribosomal protein L21